MHGMDENNLTKVNYQTSIPMEKVLNPKGDVIICHSMNDVNLPRDHGFPLRMIIPGFMGARNVKWVNRLIISQNQSQSPTTKEDYKLFKNPQ